MATGSIVVRVFTSDSEIPLDGASVSITKMNELLAFELTDYDGYTKPLFIETPDESESQSYIPGAKPFTTVNIIAEKNGYDRILVENVQVFGENETRQDFQLIPTAELPDYYDKTQVFNVTPQNL